MTIASNMLLLSHGCHPIRFSVFTHKLCLTSIILQRITKDAQISTIGSLKRFNSFQKASYGIGGLIPVPNSIHRLTMLLKCAICRNRTLSLLTLRKAGPSNWVYFVLAAIGRNQEHEWRDSVELLRLAALVHDIGKTGVRGDVLLKEASPARKSARRLSSTP